MQARRKINVISLDFDGCVFNRNYISNTHDANRLIAYNHGLLNTITHNLQQNDYTKAIFMVGSNRQSKNIDDLNAYIGNKGSCFPALMKIREEIASRLANENLSCEIDDYLLADSYGRKNPGNTFQACVGNDEKFDHHHWFFDERKLSILYAQMHKIASENPDTDITYDFYDDKHDIHDHLTAFFKEYPGFIPKNVQLRLNHYNGDSITHKCTINGTGIIDFYYHSSLFDMLKHAQIPHSVSSDGKLERYDAKKTDCLISHFKRDLAARPKAFLAAVKAKPHNLIAGLAEQIEASTGAAAREAVIVRDKLTPEEATILTVFHDRLKNLHHELARDINQQMAAGVSLTDIQHSNAIHALNETSTLLTNLAENTKNKATLLQHIQTYETNCKKTSRWSTFWKAIAVVAIVAAGVVIGGAIGMAIGIAAGSWSGPGAALTGLAGLFTGAVTGASIGLAIGAAATGMVAGAVSAGLLFRDTPLEEKITLVADQSRMLIAK